MGRKHKHEEHENHERWVISYADMVTLLFALFVVLYALGEVKLRKLKDLKKSLAFAFHFEGSGKTQEDGVHERGDIGGDLLEAAAIVNAQKGAMIEFVKDTMTREFEEVTGRSLEIRITDDTIAVSGRLSDFFPRNQPHLRDDVTGMLSQLVERSYGFAEHIRLYITAPKVRIGYDRARRAPYYSGELCASRLLYVQKYMGYMKYVAQEQVQIEFAYMPADRPASGHWENTGTVTFAFSNIAPNPPGYDDK